MSDQIKIIVKVANIILLNKSNQLRTENVKIVWQDLDHKLQKSYKEYYENSDIKTRVKRIKNTDDPDNKVLQIVSEAANKGEGGWTATFPNLRTEDQGMDCTLAAATLNAGLKDLGYDSRSTLRSGHYVVSRLLENGDVKIYDPATRVTKDGITSGYSRIFNSNEVNLTDINERDGRKGTKIQLTINQQDLPGGFCKQDPLDGKYKQILYASSPETLLDLSVALENIDSLKKDAKGIPTTNSVQSETQPDVWKVQAKQIVNNYPEISNFDHQKSKEQLNFFDPYDVIKKTL